MRGSRETNAVHLTKDQFFKLAPSLKPESPDEHYIVLTGLETRGYCFALRRGSGGVVKTLFDSSACSYFYCDAENARLAGEDLLDGLRAVIKDHYLKYFRANPNP